MSSRPVVFVAFEDQDNLGVGYIASTLLEAGFPVRILDIRLGAQAILQDLIAQQPLAVGFSVIFQYHIDRFRELLTALREGGVACHFTAGGHYPSLRPDELLRFMPQLDSIVLFEGEHTFLELAARLNAGQDWRDVHGIAHRQDDEIIRTPLRPVEPDLDAFPFPVRLPLREFAYGRKFATLLAGRGCVNRCSFCSIREFYRGAGGPVKRVREPAMVVREIELLHHELGCSVFFFQDDDFPITYKRGAWLRTFCELLDEKGLAHEIVWKMNCRSDEVTPETVAYMKAHGLFLAYLGIESGTDEGLARMEKRLKAQDNLRAAQVLKELDVLYDYGFMLFDPGSTFDNVRRELDFLDELCGDGSSPITFCKMLPLAGTAVEQALAKANRLIGPPGHLDYLFDDPRLQQLFGSLEYGFNDWVADTGGLLNTGRWVRHYLAMHRHMFGPTPTTEDLRRAVQTVIGDSNRAFTALARRMADRWEGDGAHGAADLEEEARQTHQRYSQELNALLPSVLSLPC